MATIAHMKHEDKDGNIWFWYVDKDGDSFTFSEYKGVKLVCKKTGDFMFMMAEFISAASVSTGNLIDYIQNMDGDYIFIPRNK